jgi:hypothetical protein
MYKADGPDAQKVLVRVVPGLVAEAVVAILAHAVEMCLVFTVVAVGELAVLVKPAKRRSFQHQPQFIEIPLSAVPTY